MNARAPEVGADAPVLGGSKWWICAATMTAAFLALLDISIVNICLPQIQVHYGADVDQLGWVTTGYMIANVIAMPLTGWFRAQWGYRRYFVTSAILFGAGSALCAVAFDFESFVLARAIQGLGGGALIPLSQSIIADRFPRSQVAIAGALFGVAAMAGPVLGPSLGGHLLDYVSWPWLFWVSVPVAVATSVIVFVHLEEPAPTPDPRVKFDRFGFALLAIGLGSLQFVLEEGPRREWLESYAIVVTAILASLCLPALVLHALESEYPVVDLRVFASKRFAAGSAVNAVLGVAMMSGAFFNSLFFANVLGYSPVAIGDVLLWANAVDFVAIPASSVLLRWVDGRFVLVAGVGLLVWSFARNATLGLTADWNDLVFPAAVRSLGSSVLYFPLVIAAFIGMDEKQRPGALGIFHVLRELGASIGTASAAHLLARRTEHHGLEIARALDVRDLTDPRSGGVDTIMRAAGNLAALEGFSDVYTAFALLCAVVAPCILFLDTRGSEFVPGGGRGPAEARAQRSDGRPPASTVE